MKIETKFEVGQKVFIIASGNIQEKRIVDISIKIRNTTSITYETEGFFREESSLFATKEDAVVAWLSQQNIDMVIIKGKI